MDKAQVGEVRELSDDAKMILSGFFHSGPKTTVKSSPPHATIAKYAAAWQELLDRGLITKEPFNRFDVWLYRGTDAGREACEEFHRARLLSALGASHAQL
jgi:hypothetical protein